MICLFLPKENIVGWRLEGGKVEVPYGENIDVELMETAFGKYKLIRRQPDGSIIKIAGEY